MTDILEEIKQIISTQFGIPVEKIQEDSLLDEDLSITDLDLEDFMGFVQKKYEINIDQEQFPSFKKVTDIVSCLYDNLEISN